jgi:hypothetical protein
LTIVIEFDELLVDSEVVEVTPDTEVITLSQDTVVEVDVATDVEVIHLTQFAVVEVDAQPPVEIVHPSQNTVIVTGGKGEKGEDGAPGAAGSAPQSYVHEQVDPSAVWIINHGLGFYPNVTVIDSGGNEVAGDITYVDLDHLIDTFVSSFGGNAYCS